MINRNQFRLGKRQRAIIDKLVDFRILWGDDFNYPEEKRALQSLIKRELLTFDADDDNGGSIEFTELGRKMFDHDSNL